MARMYTVVFENVAVTAAQDLLEITPADDKPVRLMGMVLSNLSEVGDAMEEMLRITVVRGHTTSGSGGTAPTPTPVDPTDTAAGFTAEVNNTTIASAGTAPTLVALGWNERNTPYDYWFPDERFAPKASQANTTLVVRLAAAPADSVSMSGTFFLLEE